MVVIETMAKFAWNALMGKTDDKTDRWYLFFIVACTVILLMVFRVRLFGKRKFTLAKKKVGTRRRRRRYSRRRYTRPMYVKRRRR